MIVEKFDAIKKQYMYWQQIVKVQKTFSSKYFFEECYQLFKHLLQKNLSENLYIYQRIGILQ